MSHPYTLDQALSFAGLRFGSRLHVVDEERRWSFSDLQEEAVRIAARFVATGVHPGNRVAIPITNSGRHLAAIFAVWGAGGVLVPLNPRLSRAEEEAICERSGAVMRVTCGARDLEILPLARGTDPADPELAAIAYTSGTTGSPKGVEITHANMLWAAAAVVNTRRDGADSVAAMVSPICHLPVFVSHYLARLLSGGTVVAGAFDADRLLSHVAEHRITDLPLVPSMVAPLLDRSSASRSLPLRKVTVGSALTPMETKQALAARFPGAEIIEAYGQTESTDGLTMTVGREALERAGTVGRAHSIIPVAIMGPDGAQLPPGETGEIVCQGPTVMRGYYEDAAATAAALRDGWLHTGDLGRMDEDGYLYITGRLKEIIISGGENVSPEEVETVLLRHPAVVEAAVFGVPDARWGERVVAAVVVREAVTAEALSSHVADRLARFKRPKQVFFVDVLPKTAAGKVRRQSLRDRFGSA